METEEHNCVPIKLRALLTKTGGWSSHYSLLTPILNSNFKKVFTFSPGQYAQWLEHWLVN